MSYFDIYRKRLNRYGIDYQSRIQNQREREFDDYLLKTIYWVSFDYAGMEHIASLEPDKQDETEVLQYLLTKRDLDIPGGTILALTNKDNLKSYWMIYWKEDKVANGYNKYLVLKMTDYIIWKDKGDLHREGWTYFCGPAGGRLKDDMKSSGINVLYAEDGNSHYLILPIDPNIKKDDYLTIGEGELKQAFVVTGLDFSSVDGVEYVTLDPVFIRDETPAPERTSEDSVDDFYWLEQKGVE